MDSGDIASLGVLLLLLLCSAFFSSAETAFMTVNKIRMRSLEEEGVKNAAVVCKLTEEPSKLLSTILIGNNVVNILTSSLATVLATKYFGSAAVGFVTGILTILILLFGEITPKSMATYHAEKMSLLYAKPVYLLTRLLTPVIYVINKLSNGIVRLFGIDPNEKPTAITEKELLTIVDVSHEEGVIETEEREMITNVVDFGDTMVKDIMVPRVEVCCVNQDVSYQELVEKFQKDKYTRLPVYKDSIDEIVGVVSIKDIFFYKQEHQWEESFSIEKCMRKPYFTYEFKKTSELLREIKRESVSLAIVLDEYGSMVGVVTMEDLLEEIVGDIRDEYDQDEVEDIRFINEGEYIAKGSVRLEEFNELTGLEIQSNDYDSIGGYMIEQLDHIPEVGEAVQTENVTLTVLSVEKQRIGEIGILIAPKEEEDKEAEKEEKPESRKSGGDSSETEKKSEKDSVDRG